MMLLMSVPHFVALLNLTNINLKSNFNINLISRELHDSNSRATSKSLGKKNLK